MASSAAADADAKTVTLAHQEQPASASSIYPRPKPYTSWWNPNLPWIDLFICWIASFFIPLGKIAEYPPTSKEAQERNAMTRLKFNKSIETAFRQYCRMWSKACGGLVQCTWKVPRKPEILYQWNIIDEKDLLLKEIMEKESNNDDKFVTVHVWCPASLVLKGDDRQVNANGCIEVDSINLKDIAREVPVVLWFHGGGLTLGTCDDSGWGPKLTALLEKQKKTSGSDSIPPMLVASVDYRLAPDHPLPAASIDALSALDYCLASDPTRKIHVGGESAGAYLTLVSVFAGHKHYPDRIQSSFAMVPFISPAADSMSYYMNSSSSPLVTIPWARWCWRAALEMEETVDDNEEDVLALESNRTAWNKSKWKQNDQWHKFLEPMEGIPSGLDNKKFIISVNKADPLYDEGNELMRMLKEEGADVEYVEAMGSHAIGFEVDRKAMEELIDIWRAAIFD